MTARPSVVNKGTLVLCVCQCECLCVHECVHARVLFAVCGLAKAARVWIIIYVSEFCWNEACHAQLSSSHLSPLSFSLCLSLCQRCRDKLLQLICNRIEEASVGMTQSETQNIGAYCKWQSISITPAPQTVLSFELSGCELTFPTTRQAPVILLKNFYLLLENTSSVSYSHKVWGNSTAMVFHFTTCTHIMLNGGY